MSEYDFIFDTMRFSYSSLSSFETCAHAFKLNYLNGKKGINNAWASYGSFVHTIFQKFFLGELENFELAKYYKDNYYHVITEEFPSYPQGMREGYYADGLDFFENFDFDKSKYEVISVEDNFDALYKGITLAVRPDIVLKNKENKSNILLDFKTSKLQKGENNKHNIEKIAGYRKQLELYAQFIWQEKEIEINKIFLWFIRNNQFVEIGIDRMKILDTLDWIEDTVGVIKQETQWKPNTKKSNLYFCKNICGYREICEYRDVVDA